MLHFILLAVVAAANVVAQAVYDSSPPSYDPSSFNYHGCSAVDLSRFSGPIVFSDGLLTHQACQMACQGQQFAALFPDSCRCGNDATAVTPLDESACDYPCMGEPSQGMCGSNCPDQAPGVSTVFARSSPPDDSPDPTTDGTPISPASASSSSSTETHPEDTVPASTSPNSSGTASTSQTSPSEDPEPLPTAAPIEPNGDDPPSPAHTVPTHSAPGESTTPASADSTETWTLSSVTSSSHSSFTPILGNISDTQPSEKPAGDPSAPSQLPASDSSLFSIPVLSTIGGLTFIVALVV